MKKKLKEIREGVVTIFSFIIFGLAITGWILNLVIFFGLNFSTPYRAEVFRAIGVFSPAGAIFGYLDINDSVADIDNIKKFSESMDLNNQATRIMNRIGDEKRQFTADEYLIMLDSKKNALIKAKAVNIEELNNDYKEFGNQYQENFIKGLEFQIIGWEEIDAGKSLQGQILENEWGKWYENNIKNIQKL